MPLFNNESNYAGLLTQTHALLSRQLAAPRILDEKANTTPQHVAVQNSRPLLQHSTKTMAILSLFSFSHDHPLALPAITLLLEIMHQQSFLFILCLPFALSSPLHLCDRCTNNSSDHDGTTCDVADIVFSDVEGAFAGVEGLGAEFLLFDDVLDLKCSSSDVWTKDAEALDFGHDDEMKEWRGW